MVARTCSDSRRRCSIVQLVGVPCAFRPARFVGSAVRSALVKTVAADNARAAPLPRQLLTPRPWQRNGRDMKPPHPTHGTSPIHRCPLVTLPSKHCRSTPTKQTSRKTTPAEPPRETVSSRNKPTSKGFSAALATYIRGRRRQRRRGEKGTHATHTCALMRGCVLSQYIQTHT